MKVVTSSIAIVALTAFAGLLVLPCSSSESSYLELDTFLTQSARSEELEGSVLAIWQFIADDAEFKQCSKEFSRNCHGFWKLRAS